MNDKVYDLTRSDISVSYQMMLIGIGIAIGSLFFRDFSKEHLSSIVCIEIFLVLITIFGTLIIFSIVNWLY
jgi:hypothetical protein